MSFWCDRPWPTFFNVAKKMHHHNTGCWSATIAMKNVIRVWQDMYRAQCIRIPARRGLRPLHSSSSRCFPAVSIDKKQTKQDSKKNPAVKNDWATQFDWSSVPSATDLCNYDRVQHRNRTGDRLPSCKDWKIAVANCRERPKFQAQCLTWLNFKTFEKPGFHLTNLEITCHNTSTHMNSHQLLSTHTNSYQLISTQINPIQLWINSYQLIRTLIHS